MIGQLSRLALLQLLLRHCLGSGRDARTMGRKVAPSELCARCDEAPKFKSGALACRNAGASGLGVRAAGGKDQGNRDQRPTFRISAHSISPRKSVSAAEDAATVMRMPHLRRSG